ncbi:MAG: MlaD family protein [Candidatus Omnitrophota bacterium]|jgi:phospholipid/cholesterol/gamma-HCH transport system substrate-binding protein
MRKMDLEFKVGIFVAIGIAILMSMIFSLKELKYAQQKYTIKVRFGFANGIEVAAPVRVAGVQVGEVKNIEIVENKEANRMAVDLYVWLDKKIKVEKDAEAFINTLGLIGEKYVEILPGTPGSEALKPGERLVGRESVPMEKLTEKAYEVGTGLGDTIKHFNKLVGDPETQAAFKATMLDLRKFMASANTVMDKVKSGEGTVGKLFMDEGLYNELDAFVKDIKAHPWKLLSKPRGER